MRSAVSVGTLWMAAAFGLYGLMATTLLATNMPPFQGPDEFAHFLRAAQIADGVLIGTRVPTGVGQNPSINEGLSQSPSGGGFIDPNFWEVNHVLDSLAFHPDVRAVRADWTPDIHWSAARILAAFPNTAVYPPFFYVPSAIGVLAGREANLSIVETLIVSRLLTGVTAVAIGVMAIVIAGGAAPWIFTILTMPTSLSLIASASQDALLLGCSGLAGALFVRGLRWPAMPRAKLLILGLTATLGLAAMARPPYGALAMLPLGLTNVRWRWRVLATMAVAACVLIWWAIAAATTLTEYNGPAVGANPAAQLALLVGDPVLIAKVAWATLTQYSEELFIQFVGLLGWNDTNLPYSYHLAARVMLAIAAVTATLAIREKGDRSSICSYLVVVGAVLLSAAGVFGSQYVYFTKPGSSTVANVVGRYFLPLALVSAALLPRLGSTRLARLRDALLIIVIGFPVVSVAVMMRAIVLRYYLG